MLTVLFVDDEPMVLEGIRRALRDARHEWNMLFAPSAARGLELLASQPVDVVVTDMRMPGMDGHELLEAVRKDFPAVIRLMLSGQADQSTLMRTVGCAHQFMAKPCDLAVLRTTISRSVALRSLLADQKEALGPTSIETLPAPPAVYQELVECLSDTRSSLKDAAAIIARDPALTSLLLKVSNSAFFGPPRPVTTIERACSFLGMEIISGLTLNRSLVVANPGLFREGAPLAAWPAHSLQVAGLSRRIATLQEFTEGTIALAFLVGLLHDVGDLVLATQSHAASGDSDTRHAHLGAYLLGLWGFAPSIIDAIAWHHDPTRQASGNFELKQVVYLADRIATHPGANSPQALELDCAFTTRPDFASLWHKLAGTGDLVG